jgi:hypothetical protein
LLILLDEGLEIDFLLIIVVVFIIVVCKDVINIIFVIFVVVVFLIIVFVRVYGLSRDWFLLFSLLLRLLSLLGLSSNGSRSSIFLSRLLRSS